MKEESAKKVINEMKTAAESYGLGLMAVGSIGYRDAVDHPQNLVYCDDFDCIFIYEKFDDLTHLPFLEKFPLDKAKSYLDSGKADMISNKFFRQGIMVSADYISMKYLEDLSREEIGEESRFRSKLTSAEEKPTNTYRSFTGKEYVYRKQCEMLDGSLRIYKLPIHYFAEGNFCPGVLLNKFLYHPLSIASIEHQNDLIADIHDKMLDYRDSIKIKYPNAALVNSAYRSEFISDEIKEIIERRQRTA